MRVRLHHRIFDTWLACTPGEQTAILIVLALFVLGVLARWIHALHGA